MRGLSLFFIGLVLGAAIPLFWWPRIPARTPLPVRSDVRLSLSYPYLARLMEDRLNAVTTIRVTGLTVDGIPPSALAGRGTISAQGITTPVSVEAVPSVQNGTLTVRIVNAAAGAIPFPVGGLFSSAVTSAVQKALGAHTHVTGVFVTGGHLDLTANYAP